MLRDNHEIATHPLDARNDRRGVCLIGKFGSNEGVMSVEQLIETAEHDPPSSREVIAPDSAIEKKGVKLLLEKDSPPASLLRNGPQANRRFSPLERKSGQALIIQGPQ